MRLFKKLTAYNKDEINDAIFGFGVLRAKDYEKNRYGRLFLFSINTPKVKFIKKLFVKKLINT